MRPVRKRETRVAKLLISIAAVIIGSQVYGSQLVIRIRVPKGQKDIIKDHAVSQDESLNAFVVHVINETMQRDFQPT